MRPDSRLRAALARLAGPVDVALSLAVVPAAYLLLAYRRLGARRLPRTTARLKRIGVYPIRDHYYEPLFDDRRLTGDLAEPRPLPGLDLGEAGQLALLDRLDRADELVALDLAGPPGGIADFRLGNEAFESGDAEMLYQMIRHLRPAKVIEVGSGHSTRLARLALQANARETGKVAEHVCIEPYEQPWLERLEGVTVIRQRIEASGIDWATALGPGDLLFVDSSHVIRPQGDVLAEYLDIFPRLAPGVIVHVHDVFTPRDYLREWVVDNVWFWNEQYLLEALLSDSPRYQVVAAVNFLKRRHYQRLAQVCPYLTPDREPGSFYFRVRG
jgi:hypothetical protein